MIWRLMGGLRGRQKIARSNELEESSSRGPRTFEFVREVFRTLRKVPSFPRSMPRKSQAFSRT